MITKAWAPCSWLPCWRGQLIVHCTLFRELREWFFNYFVVRQILQFVSQTVERCFHLPIMPLNLFMDFFHLFVNLLHIFVNFFVNIFYILIQLFQKVGCRTICVAAAVIWSWEFLLDLLGKTHFFFFLFFFFLFFCLSMVCGMQDCWCCGGQCGAEGSWEDRGAPKPNQNWTTKPKTKPNHTTPHQMQPK